MSFIYAIDEWQLTNREYIPASKEVAEAHINGVFALVDNNGDRIHFWTKINSAETKEIQKAVDKAIRRKRDASIVHEDCQSDVLEIGEYVKYDPSLGYNDAVIAQVIGFTRKRVKLLMYGRLIGCHYGISDCLPHHLIKIDPTILSD